MLGVVSECETAITEDAPELISVLLFDMTVRARPFVRARASLYQSHFDGNFPIVIVPPDVLPCAYMGSFEVPKQYRRSKTWANYQKPSVFYTPSTEFERNNTWAGIQGSREKPLPKPWRKNYLFPTFWEQAYPLAKNFFIDPGAQIHFNFFPFTMSFGVSCEYQPEAPPVGVFVPDVPLVGNWVADPAMGIEWDSESNYCTEGNQV